MRLLDWGRSPDIAKSCCARPSREQLGDHNAVCRPVTVRIQFNKKAWGAEVEGAAAVRGWAERLRDVFDQLHTDGAFPDFRRARFRVE